MTWIDSVAQPLPPSSSSCATCVWWTSGRAFLRPWPWCLLDCGQLLYLHGWAAFLEAAVLPFATSWGQGRERREACIPNRQLLARGLAVALQVVIGRSPNWAPACTAATHEIQWLDFRSTKCEFSGTCHPKAKFDAILGGERRGKQFKKPYQNHSEYILF